MSRRDNRTITMMILPHENSFDVITMLEVLEHIPEAEKAITEICKVARYFVIISTPSKVDENPEHIHLFNATMLEEMLKKNGAISVDLTA